MVQRCTNPNNIGWEKYGGAGITVCTRWLDFQFFLADLGERPAGTTLGRFRDIGKYEPGNVKWMTWTEQRTEQKIKKQLLNLEVQ